MPTARFAGIVDVPLFESPDVPITDYVGFPASPAFSPSSDVPMFSYQPQSPSGDPKKLGRVAAIIPTLDGSSQVVLNPTTVPGLAGMSNRITHLDGFTYALNETETSGGGVNYNWMLFKMFQGREAGIEVANATPSRWYITPSNPFVAVPNIRREFQLGIANSFDFMGSGVSAGILYNWNNNYNRVYCLLQTVFGLRLRNAFGAAELGMIFPQFVAGVASARFAQKTLGGNHLFVGKGLKDSAYVLHFNLMTYDPDTIDATSPGKQAVSLPAGVYQDALDNVINVTVWKNGFVLTLDTGGAGVTGQNQEVIVTDPYFKNFVVLRFVPQTSGAEEALVPDNTNWSCKIDTEGTIWFYNGGIGGFKNKVYNSWSPALFFNPRLLDIDLPAVTMPCYNTCLPGYF